MNPSLSERIARTLEQAQGRALEFEGRWHDWPELGAAAQVIFHAFDDAVIGPGSPIGLVTRNRPGALTAYLAILARSACVVTINPMQTPQAIASEIRELRLPVVIAYRHDWSAPEILAAAREVGSMGLAIEDEAAVVVAPVAGLERPGSGPYRAPMPEVAVEMLTSGTTGLPKRVSMRYKTLSATVEDVRLSRMVMGEAGNPDTPLVEYQPLVGIGGVYTAAYVGAYARPYVLQEKFEPVACGRALAAYRPKVIGLNPALMRMVISAKIPADCFSSLLAVRSGSAPLDPETRRRWESDYGIPILLIYGATEFGGPVTYWTLEDYHRHYEKKGASVGRASPGMALRIVDRDSGAMLPTGATGILEVRVDRIGPEWMRTNDIANIDEDGFLFIHARADDAINRGGFKILPELIGDALRRHPAVADAAVVGMPDPRLGHVPVAAVECHRGVPRPTVQELREFLRGQLLAYQVPVELLVVDALPRNAALKVPRDALLALFQTRPGNG